jgi:multisubunit Na+/H+ antiporter MnhG subunit
MIEKKTVRKLGIFSIIATVGMGIILGLINYLMSEGIIDGNPREYNAYFFLLLLIPVAIMSIIFNIFKRGRYPKRKSFSAETKEKVLRRQNYRCKICGTSPQHFDFDHIGSRADNSMKNCQALCLDCHRTKTINENRNNRNNRNKFR